MRQLVTQVSAAAGVGIAIMAVKKMFRAEIHPLVKSHESIMRHPPLAEVLTNIVSVCNQSECEILLKMVDDVAALLEVQHKANPWHIARMNGAIIRHAKQMCRVTGKEDNERFQNSMLVKEEYLPQLEVLLDNMLHNYLLDG